MSTTVLFFPWGKEVVSSDSRGCYHLSSVTPRGRTYLRWLLSKHLDPEHRRMNRRRSPERRTSQETSSRTASLMLSLIRGNPTPQQWKKIHLKEV